MPLRYLITALLCFLGLQSFSLVPSISASGTVYGMTATYGLGLGYQSFNVSATGLQGAITVVAPAGFEVSADDVNYSSTITLDRSLTLSGAFSQSAGTLSEQSNTFTVGGNFTYSGGTLNAGTGMLAFSDATGC